jgi:hypothetical protein
LDAIAPQLKDWKGGLICSTSQGTTLVYHGAPPTHMCCLDPRAAPDPELDIPDGGWDRTHYVAHVSGPKPYWDKWFEKTESTAHVLRILEPTVPWYTMHLPWAYPWVKVGMLPFIDSVSSEVSLAWRLGFDPLFLIGVDYGGPRFEQWLWKDGAWEKGKASGYVASTYQDHRESGVQEIELHKRIGSGGLETDESMLYSKRGLLIASFMKIMDARRPIRIYQMSKPSNIVEFPFAPFSEVMERQGLFPSWSEEERAATVETIEVELARTDTYMMPVDSGFGRDYRVFMIHPANVMQALSDLNLEILTNKADLKAKEKHVGMPVKEQIEKGILVVEHGELLIHERADLEYFDLDKMRGVDIEKTAAHILGLHEKAQTE